MKRKIAMICLGVVLFALQSGSQEMDTESVPSAGSIADSLKLGTEQLSASNRMGTLIIDSKPADAVVVVDDKPQGRTPLTIDSLLAGEHVIILKKEGYFLKKVTAKIPADTTTTLSLTLIRPLKLTIISQPSGAQLVLDGKKEGVTPFSTQKLKPGAHTVVLSLDGYKLLTQTVPISENSPDTFNLALEPLKQEPTGVIKSTNPSSGGGKQKKINRIALGVFLALTCAIFVIEFADTSM